MNGAAVISVNVLLLAACGLGSVHPGDKARINVSAATACDSLEAFARLDQYVNEDHNVERANRELMAPGHCHGIKQDEAVSVVGESGEYREIQRSDGTRVWTSWVFLLFTGH